MPMQAMETVSIPHGYPQPQLYKSSFSRRMTLGPPPLKTRVKKDQWDASGHHVVLISFA